jgi:hypothetical protein
MNEPLMHATIALAARCAERNAPPTEQEALRIAQELAHTRGLSHHDCEALFEAARRFSAPWDELPDPDSMVEVDPRGYAASLHTLPGNRDSSGTQRSSALKPSFAVETTTHARLQALDDRLGSGCLCCGAEPEIGTLCRNCAQEVTPCEGLIPDHIHSRTDSTDAEAWVVDGFGIAHPIAARSRIGRNHENELIVLVSSLSRKHAELQRAETGWVVTDLGSRNGTFVNGVRVQGSAPLPGHAVLRVGDIVLWFLAEIVGVPVRRLAAGTRGHSGPLVRYQLAMGTDGTRGGLVRYQLVRGDKELCIVATDNDASAGALLWREVGTDAWSERSLAPLEFQLLRALCIRAHEEATSPSTIRGCVSTKQLVNDLPFQSKYANQENVRQVVLRLRGVLAEVGVGGLLAVAPDRGYYLASPVSVGLGPVAGLPERPHR